MHLFNTLTLFLVITLVGVEFSVSAFVNPAARRLPPEPQLAILSRLAIVLGRVMPIWYPGCAVLFILQTWLGWHTQARAILLVAAILWAAASLASIAFLVPLNTRIANRAPDWQQASITWDQRHRIRIAVLAAAALLLTFALTS